MTIIAERSFKTLYSSKMKPMSFGRSTFKFKLVSSQLYTWLRVQTAVLIYCTQLWNQVNHSNWKTHVKNKYRAMWKHWKPAMYSSFSKSNSQTLIWLIDEWNILKLFKIDYSLFSLQSFIYEIYKWSTLLPVVKIQKFLLEVDQAFHEFISQKLSLHFHAHC